MINKKTLVKYGVGGLAMGLIIVCAVYFLLSLFVYPVRGMDELQLLNIRCLGEVSKAQTKRQEDIKRIAYGLSLCEKNRVITYLPIDEYNSKVEIGQALKNAFEFEGKNVKVFNSSEEDMTELVKKINDSKKSDDILFIYAKNIKENADSTLLLKNSDSVILGVEYGKTKMKDLEFAVNEINFLDVELLGAVINNTHN